MKTSIKGINLIKKYESLSLQAYKCPAGKWTIGFGNTTWEDGKAVKEGQVITIERADKLLIYAVGKFEELLNKKIKVELNQNQFDALVCYTFNTGGSLTLFNLINNKEREFEIRDWWITKYITANGKVLPGLIKRRKEEVNLFYSI
jgi:lysozyme